MHLLTGPVAIENAEPGDILEVRILDVRPRPSCNACHAGRCFGSNAAASWGFHYHDLIEEPKPREVITIFELDTSGEPFAKAVYNYVWTPQTDPDGIMHPTIDYPGVRGRSHPGARSARTSCRTSRCRRACISARWGWRRRNPISSARFRPAIPAAISTIGASARARGCIIRSPSPARFSRSAIRMRRRVTANSAAPRSRPR